MYSIFGDIADPLASDSLKIDIVIASISELKNLRNAQFPSQHECRILVIDEGDLKLRKKNDERISDKPHEYYGPKERELWFKKQFGRNYRKYLDTIPERCHAETSFGFLVAYEENADIIIEIDDDVSLLPNKRALIDLHLKNLFSRDGETVLSNAKWYNSMENLALDNIHFFPRGHPYSLDARKEDYQWINSGDKCVLNMGLWLGNPDLDALTILYKSGLDGKFTIEGGELKRSKVLLDNGVYTAICSMNTAFVRRIVPAFYQLYMNVMGVDRFDDIWSGIFVKKVADSVGDKICLGEPLVYHDKKPRNVFKDLTKELNGMEINEFLWKMVDELELNGRTYWEAYNSLTEGLTKNITKIPNQFHREFLQIQVKKMNRWLEITDKINP
jgi:hypothetical protein